MSAPLEEGARPRGTVAGAHAGFAGPLHHDICSVDCQADVPRWVPGPPPTGLWLEPSPRSWPDEGSGRISGWTRHWYRYLQSGRRVRPTDSRPSTLVVRHDICRACDANTSRSSLAGDDPTTPHDLPFLRGLPKSSMRTPDEAVAADGPTFHGAPRGLAYRNFLTMHANAHTCFH